NTCVGADSVRTWSSPGTCASGVCSYQQTVTMCAAAPGPTCADASTLRTFTAGCANGACGTTPTDTFCPGGCSAGACVPLVCTRGETRPCSAECFCEENLIDDETLTDIVAISAGDVWVSGTNGSLVHYDGGTWARSPPLTNATLNALKLTTAGTVWAVGSNGTVLRHAAGVWSAMDAGTRETLRALDGTDTFMWAVGDRGTVALWDGTAWSVRDAGTSVSLTGVSFSSSTVAVGSSGTGSVAFNLSSTSITANTLPTNIGTLRAIAPDVGGHTAVGFQGTLLNKVGSSWSAPVTLPSTVGNAFLGRIRDGWVVGQRTLSGSGTSWTDRTNSVGSGWSGVSQVPFGGPTFFVEPASVSRFASSTLTPLTAGALDFHDVWGTSADQVWLVGEDAQLRGRLRRWNGSQFEWGGVVGLWGNGILNGVWGSAANDVYAVGQDFTILRFDGTVWNVVAYAPAQFTTWMAVHGSSASNVWVVGYERLRRFDGTSWTLDTLSGFGVINDVFTFGPTSGWVVGASARQRTAAGWATVTTGAPGTLHAVWASGTNDVWVGGAGGFVARWNGTSFAPLATGTTATVLDIHGRGPNDVFIVGAGFVKHWDGVRLRDVASGTGGTRSVEAVWAGTGTDVWLVGERGIARHRAQ
ncbi:MAG: hypothetical protein JNM17_14695, partial [Archangium sp.]|nr:hypothetical protein [Archangium sp.]